MVIGYNTARYDLNVILNPLLRELGIVDAEPGTCNIIKQGNTRSSITTPDFKFRDFMKYQAPGQSYDKVIRAEGINSPNVRVAARGMFVWTACD